MKTVCSSSSLIDRIALVLERDFILLQFCQNQIMESIPQLVEVEETFFDMSSGEQGFLDEPLATKLFRPLEEPMNTCTKLYFGNLSFGVEAALVAKRVLMGIQKTLTDVELVHFVFDRSESEALEIKCLHFYDNESDDDAAEALSVLVKKCIALEDFRFSGNPIGTDGAIALVEALTKGNRLKMLNLSNNVLGKRGGVALNQVIPQHLGLTEVYFNYMKLKDEGFYAAQNKLKDDGSIIICKAISEGHEKLKELNLSTNAITRFGAKAAAEAVADKPDFSRLFISGNFITKKGIETVKDVLRKGTKGDSVLGVLYQYKYIGDGMYQCEEEGLSDSETELEEKQPKLRYDSDTDTELEFYGLYE
ncbi:hypothetical protein SUGI_0671520 [Cryptomeria japonica]|nr:hypothetical protein SUGI_0671520 [Cryptomeria japonica]